MEITKLGSATVTVKTKDVKILCDPWLMMVHIMEVGVIFSYQFK